MVFQPLLQCTSTHPKEIQIICSHILVRLPRKISFKCALRGPSNQPRQATRAKNGENHLFLTGFQLLLPCTSTHPNEIQTVCSHTLPCLPSKISAGSAHSGWSNFGPLRTTFSTVGPPKYQLIRLLSEICPPGNAKCHNQKFCWDWSILSGLACSN